MYFYGIEIRRKEISVKIVPRCAVRRARDSTSTEQNISVVECLNLKNHWYDDCRGATLCLYNIQNTYRILSLFIFSSIWDVSDMAIC